MKSLGIGCVLRKPLLLLSLSHCICRPASSCHSFYEECAGPNVYEEAAPYYAQLRTQTSVLCSALATAGYSVDQVFGSVPSDTALAQMGNEAAMALAGLVTADMAVSHPTAAAAAAALAGMAGTVMSVEAFMHGSVTAVLASALVQVCLHHLLILPLDVMPGCVRR